MLAEKKEYANVADDSDPLLQGIPSKVKRGDVGLWLAACAENSSEHPLGKAIVNAARAIWGGDVTLSSEGVSVSDFSVIPGSGVQCTVARPDWGRWVVRVGNWEFVDFPDDEESEDGGQALAREVDDRVRDAEEMRMRGQISVFVGVLAKDFPNNPLQTGNKGVIGVIGIADSVKVESRSTVAALQRMGIDVWMCTGDHEVTAHAVAREVGITNVTAGVTPAGKADLVTRLQRRHRPGRKHGGRVAVVGDGINDSVALARADVGIAIGAGTEIAVEAADVVLVRSSLHDVVIALHLSRIVFQRIRINFIWALAYNVIALPFAAGAFYPWTDWRLPPAFAGLMMAFSSVSVVTSSLLLKSYTKPIIGEDGALQSGSAAGRFCHQCVAATTALFCCFRSTSTAAMGRVGIAKESTEWESFGTYHDMHLDNTATSSNAELEII